MGYANLQLTINGQATNHRFVLHHNGTGQAGTPILRSEKSWYWPQKDDFWGTPSYDYGNLHFWHCYIPNAPVNVYGKP